MEFTFSKSERLCSRKSIETLFSTGKIYFCFPIRTVWKEVIFDTDSTVKIAFSVPKRFHKRAHDRNLIKRRMREAYRLHKHLLQSYLENKGIRVELIMVYISPNTLTYFEIEKKLIQVLEHVQKDIEKNHS